MNDFLYIAGATIVGLVVGRLFRYLQTWQDNGIGSIPHLCVFAGTMLLCILSARTVRWAPSLGVSDYSLYVATGALLAGFSYSSRILAAIKE